jgi:hypothetical protein
VRTVFLSLQIVMYRPQLFLFTSFAVNLQSKHYSQKKIPTNQKQRFCYGYFLGDKEKSLVRYVNPTTGKGKKKQGTFLLLLISTSKI